MNKSKIIQNFSMMLLAFWGLCSCAALSGQETAGEYIDDAAITAKIKAAIVDSPSLKASRIKVETLRNVVQLSGFVESVEEKRKAEQVAKEIKGVKKVKNSLIIRK